jgi:hypothetical protein
VGNLRRDLKVINERPNPNERVVQEADLVVVPTKNNNIYLYLFFND